MIDLDNLGVDVDVTVVLGKTRMPLRRMLLLGRGAVVALDAAEGDRVEILANGYPIARGEVTIAGAAIAVEVTEMIARETVNREPGATIGGPAARQGRLAPAGGSGAQAAA